MSGTVQKTGGLRRNMQRGARGGTRLLSQTFKVRFNPLPLEHLPRLARTSGASCLHFALLDGRFNQVAPFGPASVVIAYVVET
jgi:hypothetical protein